MTVQLVGAMSQFGALSTIYPDFDPDFYSAKKAKFCNVVSLIF